MLGRKLIVIAAAVALAVAQVADAKSFHGKVTVHHHQAKRHVAVKAHSLHKHHDEANATESGDAYGDSGDADEDHEEVDEEVVELCLPGWTEVSVEGVEGIFCAKGQICVADIKDGTCPEPQQGLEYGAYCDTVKTGVYGCKPKTKEMYEDKGETPLCTGEGESPMSVEGVEGVFCVKGQACVADIKDGACPGPQEGLPNGAVCGKVKTGVYGCKPAEGKPEEKPAEGDYGEGDDEDDHDHEDSDDDDDSSDYTEVDIDVCTGEGESPMSVEGVEGVFCVKGQACVADIKDGACPDAQEGLPYGAYCGTVKTGVYGCKPKSKEQYDNEHVPYDGKPESNPALCTGEGESPMSVEGVEGIFCVKGQACVADIKDGACPGPQEGLPNGAVCGKVKTGVYGCKPAEGKPEGEPTDGDYGEEEEPSDDDDNETCGEGESPMSVEGVEGIFCVKGQACVADIKDGACPGPQEGLPNGAVCGIVKTGVYGCKPAEEKPEEEPSYDDDKTCGEGESPMSVEGVEGIFCVKGQACVADIKDGACPGPQEGLPHGAECGIVQSGVYGCKPKAAKHHRKSSPKKGHSIKVVKAHAKKVTHKKH